MARYLTNVEVNGLITTTDGVVYPDGNQQIKAYALPSYNQRGFPYFCNDFVSIVSAYPPWTGNAAATGTFTVGNTADLPGRFGVGLARSSTSANSGYGFITNTIFVVTGGEYTSLLGQVHTPAATTSIRFGFMDASSALVTVANGVYFEFTNNSVTGYISRLGVRTGSGTSFTLTYGVFYHFVIVIEPDGSGVTFAIYSDNGAYLWDSFVVATLPSGQLYNGFRSSSSGTTVIDLISLDLIDVGKDYNGVARGRPF
jgi:hypothetical protein